MDYNHDSYYAPDKEQKVDLTNRLSEVMTGVYMYMFIGLLATAFAAIIGSSNVNIFSWIVNNIIPLIIAELVLVVGLSFFLKKMSYALCITFFLLYSIINGLTLSFIFLAYTQTSIVSTFLATAITFGAMSAYGYFTKKDLTTIGNLCFMGLIGIIIAGIVNLLFKNDMLSYIISAIGLVVFIGLTAYDTQKIKGRLAEETDAVNIKRITIWGSLILYLDFINIFLKLLRFMGKRK